MFSNVSQFYHTGNIVPSSNFCFQDGDYAPSARTMENRNENPSMPAVQGKKFAVCEHQEASFRRSLRANRAKAKFDQILRAHLN